MATNPLESFLQSYQAGKETQAQNRLLDMRQQAFDAEQASAAQKQAGEDRDRQLATLQQTASLYPNAPDMLKPHLYGQIVDLAEGVGFAPKGQLPRQLTPEVEPKFQQFLQSFASIGKQQPSLSDRYRVVGGSLIDLTNPEQPVYSAPEKPQFQVDAAGNGYWIAPGQAPLPVDATSIGSPSGNYQDVYADIASRHGSAITSGVRPVLPGVGAGANSQHPKGTAADFRTNGLQPQQIDALMSDLRSQGFEVIDERDNRNGRGPHIHAELPPGGLKFPTRGNASTEDKAANWQIVQGQDGTFYRVNKLTGETVSSGVQGANALRMQDQHQKRADAVAGIEGAIRSTDETIQSLNLLLTHPGRGSGTGKSALFPAVPGTDRKDFDAQLATFKAQTFIPMVSQLKGMGALSDAEGKKLMDAVGAIDPQMSEGAFTDSLNRIKAQLLRAQAAAYKKVEQLKRNQAPTSAPPASPASAGRPQLPPGFSWED